MNKKTTIKAWAVVTTYPKRIKHPVEPTLTNANIESDCGCGYPTTSALGIYPTEQSAKYAQKDNHWGGMVEGVVPCTISFTLPKNKHD